MTGNPARRLLVALLVIVAMLLSLSPALAHSSAYYPTLMQGARGEDVVVLERLLKHHGYSPGTIDKIFTTTTLDAVIDFQQDNNLDDDGIVGPATWAELVVTVQLGTTGRPARAVEKQLREKRDPSDPAWPLISVDGEIDADDVDAIKAFQTHMGLTSDGNVGPTTWKNLLWHFDRLRNTGNLCIFPSTWNPDKTWGAGTATAWIERGAYLFVSQQHKGLVAFQDFSWEHGGLLSPHDYHRRGMELDVELMRDDHKQCTMPTSGYTEFTDDAYNQTNTEMMIDYIEEGAVAGAWIKLFYFNDPDIVASNPLVQYKDDHDDHVHVRYCVAYYPQDSMYDC